MSRAMKTTDTETYPPRETWRRLPDGWRWVGEPRRMSEQRQAAWRAMWRMLLEKAARLAAEGSVA
jgi:hypothetical protein